MARSRVIEYCALNIVATPHPRGVYPQILTDAATRSTNYAGSSWARVSRPIKHEEGFYVGRLFVWTEIDTTEPAIDKVKLIELSLDELNLNIPPYIGFNGRIFLYVLRERDHKLIVEVRNEVGKTIAPKAVGRIFSSLLNSDDITDENPYVEVTVIPDEDALSKILAIPKLQRLKIHLVRPNPDDMSDEAEAILAELEELGAKSQDITLVAAAGGDGLELNERVSAQAEAATMNGYVAGKGKTDDGEPLAYDTKEHPRIIKWLAEGSRAFLAGAIRIAKTVRFGNGDG